MPVAALPHVSSVPPLAAGRRLSPYQPPGGAELLTPGSARVAFARTRCHVCLPSSRSRRAGARPRLSFPRARPCRGLHRSPATSRGPVFVVSGAAHSCETQTVIRYRDSPVAQQPGWPLCLPLCRGRPPKTGGYVRCGWTVLGLRLFGTRSVGSTSKTYLLFAAMGDS